MKLHELIIEKVSPIVYHATQFENAIKILESDLLKSPTGYISMSRSLTGSYPTENKIIGAIFELDGDLINQKYPGKSVGTEDYEGWGDEVTYSGKRNKQLEDRVLKGEIIDFSRYIRKVHIFIPLEYMEDNYKDEFDSVYDVNIKEVEGIVNLLNERNIPYRVVFKEKDLVNKRVDDKDKLHDFLHGDDEPSVVTYIVTLGKFEKELEEDAWDYGPPTPDESREIKVKGKPYSEDAIEDRVWTKLGPKTKWIVLNVEQQD